MKESASASHIRLEAARLGVDLWRNNVGALQDESGRVIRYGLCNDSAAVNRSIKSSDLIGLTPTIVTPDMVGSLVGIFTAIETKASDWSFIPSDQRAIAQAAFHDIVKRGGGFAGFARNAQEFRMIVKK
jgi:hypothetical protein